MSGGAAAAGALLVACGGLSEASGTGKVLIGSPDEPVTHPILRDNEPIDSGLQPEAGPLRVYNWDQYIYKRVLNEFAEEYDVEVELTTFYNLEEGIRKLRTGQVRFDIFFPTSENVPKLVAAGLFQPLNHDYLPNLEANIWPQLADPFYDRGSRYTVPYVVYQTGIGWRTDMVPDDIESMENPWDVFWDPAHKDITGLYDDYRETIGVGLYRNGVNDPNAEDPALIDKAKDSLIKLTDLVNVTYTVDGAYSKLPEGRLGLHQRDQALARYQQAKTGAAGEAAALKQAELDRIRANRRLLFWGLATVVGLFASAALKLYFLRALGVPDSPRWAEILVTGLVIGAGTKPLHDLISRIEKSKENAADPPEVGGSS